MKKVLYVITSLSHKRAFESFIERDDMQQMVLGPVPKATSGVVPEDYRDFKIQNIKTYKNKADIQSVISKYAPDVYVEASLPIANGLTLPAGCKKVYVSHGMVGSHVKGIIKKAAFNTSVWKGCDLYCGATQVFSDWVKHVAGVNDSSILLNAIPQFDILSDSSYYNAYKSKVLGVTQNPNAKKVILFAGFCCRDRCDFDCHNEDYFKTAIELERTAKENDYIIMIKPRQEHDVMMKFLKSHSWGKKYLQSYADLQKSKYVHFITTTGHIYRYFFADVFVVNGTSTVEVEACLVGRPLFVVQSGCETIDPYNTVASGSGELITDAADLENYIANSHKYHNLKNQKEWFVDRGLTIDGNMHKRIQDRIAII